MHEHKSYIYENWNGLSDSFEMYVNRTQTMRSMHLAKKTECSAMGRKSFDSLAPEIFGTGIMFDIFHEVGTIW